MRRLSLNCVISLAALLVPASLPLAAEDGHAGNNMYVQHNLVSNVAGMAARADGNLVNAWGIDHSPAGPWWVNSNGQGLSIVYDGNGMPAPAAKPIVVKVNSSPTGIVFNDTSDFQLSGMPAFFLFATEDGTILAWNNMLPDPTQAAVKVSKAGAVYKGITIGRLKGQNVIYAADFHNGTVDVYDTDFHPVTTLPSDAFHDGNVPAGFAPFNVQNIGGSIFVTFAKQDAARHDDVAGSGLGYVDRFTPEGILVTRLQHGDWMNSPWAVVQAPGNFGKLSRRMLVGQFGSGQIAAFNAETGKFQGLMNGSNGNPVTIDGLWGLKFGNGMSAGPGNVLFFAAGPNDEANGLFGTLMPPNPNDDENGDQDDNEGN